MREEKIICDNCNQIIDNEPTMTTHTIRYWHCEPYFKQTGEPMRDLIVTSPYSSKDYCVNCFDKMINAAD